ncbi:MAG: cytochrome b [Azospirillaceae bacterium]|nr:cytochrome b [Azospirillaceae bacterium]
MTQDRLALATTPPDEGVYDRLTVVFHWLTAVLVVLLFALSQIWDFLERGTPLRKGMQSLHISLGIALAVVVIVRLVWRYAGGRRLPADPNPLLHLASKAAHGALYLLLVAQVALGFLFRWAQGEPFMFFGLFSVPELLTPDKPTAHFYGDLHSAVAWIIMAIAGLHALAALYHHYGLRDGVLRRMW